MQKKKKIAEVLAEHAVIEVEIVLLVMSIWGIHKQAIDSFWNL